MIDIELNIKALSVRGIAFVKEKSLFDVTDDFPRTADFSMCTADFSKVGKYDFP